MIARRSNSLVGLCAVIGAIGLLAAGWFTSIELFRVWTLQDHVENSVRGMAKSRARLDVVLERAGGHALSMSVPSVPGTNLMAIPRAEMPDASFHDPLLLREYNREMIRLVQAGLYRPSRPGTE